MFLLIIVTDSFNKISFFFLAVLYTTYLCEHFWSVCLSCKILFSLFYSWSVPSCVFLKFKFISGNNNSYW